MYYNQVAEIHIVFFSLKIYLSGNETLITLAYIFFYVKIRYFYTWNFPRLVGSSNSLFSWIYYIDFKIYFVSDDCIGA